jgi:protein-tyrosine phosphatase
MNNENTKFNFPFSTKINRFNIDVTNNILEYYSLINNSQLNKKNNTLFNNENDNNDFISCRKLKTRQNFSKPFSFINSNLNNKNENRFNTIFNNNNNINNINNNNNVNLNLIKPKSKLPPLKLKNQLNIKLSNFQSENINKNKHNKISISFTENEDSQRKKNNNNNEIKKTQSNFCNICKQTITSNYNFHLSFHPSQIFSWLFLGNFENASNKNELLTLKIDYILNCAEECNNYFEEEFKYCHLNIKDEKNYEISNEIEKGIKFIKECLKNNKNILIHCKYGISRNTTCAIAFMIKEMNYSALNALEFIRKKRKIAMPNSGFLKQLINYEKQIKNKNNEENKSN